MQHVRGVCALESSCSGHVTDCKHVCIHACELPSQPATGLGVNQVQDDGAGNFSSVSDLYTHALNTQ